MRTRNEFFGASLGVRVDPCCDSSMKFVYESSGRRLEKSRADKKRVPPSYLSMGPRPDPETSITTNRPKGSQTVVLIVVAFFYVQAPSFCAIRSFYAADYFVRTKNSREFSISYSN